MTFAEIKQIVSDHGGTIDGGINWTWAIFSDDVKGRQAYELVAPHVESRGYYPAQPDSDNPNLHEGGFRFR